MFVSNVASIPDQPLRRFIDSMEVRHLMELRGHHSVTAVPGSYTPHAEDKSTTGICLLSSIEDPEIPVLRVFEKSRLVGLDHPFSAESVNPSPRRSYDRYR
jgi:hypothetical protein